MNKTDIFHHMRLAQVKRYPICHMNRDQSVAEHSFNVMLIATELANDESDEVHLQVLGHALMHDMDEVETGDIPSPFKRRLRRECPAVVPVLDRDTGTPELVKNIVKTADYLEAMHYMREYGGSRYAVGQIMADIYAQFALFIRDVDLPAQIKEKAKWLANNL